MPSGLLHLLNQSSPCPWGEGRAKAVRMMFYRISPLPVNAIPNSPSKLSASTLNPSSLLISKRRCGPARLGAWFSLSSGDGGSSSELEASPGPREQIRVGEGHPSLTQTSLAPLCLPFLLGYKQLLDLMAFLLQYFPDESYRMDIIFSPFSVGHVHSSLILSLSQMPTRSSFF